MFHAAACCVFKTAFSTHRHPVHPVSVLIRHPRDRSFSTRSHKLRGRHTHATQIQQGTKYIHTRYTHHACGVCLWVVFLEHGGGALLAFSSRQFAPTINHGPLSASHTYFYFSLLSKSVTTGDACRPQSKSPCVPT